MLRVACCLLFVVSRVFLTPFFFFFFFFVLYNTNRIPREQILGAEAVSKVPEQFRLQSPDIANPPAMLLTIENMLASLDTPQQESQEILNDGTQHVHTTTSTSSSSSSDTIHFLKTIYDKFALHYQWLKRTQAGVVPGTFRWRGQTSTHCLASGLDDYPRARYFTESERHVDLMAWMIYSTKILENVANRLQLDSNMYREDRILFQERLSEHWSEEDGTWYDIGVDGAEHVDPETGRVLRLEQPKHVRHYGYVGLFPFFLKIVDENDETKLLKILHNLSEPHLLWSEYGLRSLARVDPYFGKEEDYWRGKIWMNLNYLALRSLKYYSIHATSNIVKELSLRIHDELRINVIKNVYKQWRRSGFIWENYSPKNGKGKGCFPFSGWSSLIVRIMAEMYT